MNTPRGRIAFAVCGSFCTLGTATAQAGQLVRQGWELLPVMSFAASRLDTRFGTAAEWKARLAVGLSDTPVTLAAKSLLRVGCPVLIAVSTNDGLGASGENIARLRQRKHYYFVPYGQDDPAAKPQSLKADFALLPAALEAALAGRQIQPLLRERIGA